MMIMVDQTDGAFWLDAQHVDRTNRSGWAGWDRQVWAGGSVESARWAGQSGQWGRRGAWGG